MDEAIDRNWNLFPLFTRVDIDRDNNHIVSHPWFRSPHQSNPPLTVDLQDYFPPESHKQPVPAEEFDSDPRLDSPGPSIPGHQIFSYRYPRERSKIQVGDLKFCFRLKH